MQRTLDPLDQAAANSHRFITGDAHRSTLHYQGARALTKPRIADLIDDGDALTEWHRNMAKLRARQKV